jgi:hypothetical protein
MLVDNVNDQGTRYAFLVQDLEGGFHGFTVLGVGDEDLTGEGGREGGRKGRREGRVG